jgi:hypothetical protein
MAIEGTEVTSNARIRLGMVGGGKDAFIGGVHRIASRIDDRYELVAGALCPRRRKNPRLFRPGDLGLKADRAYGDFVDMANARPG